MRDRKAFLCLMTFLAIFLMSGIGCGVISHQSLNSGTEITDEQLSQVRPGMSKDDVLTILGEPTSVKNLDNGGKVWFYCWQRGGSTSVLWGTLGSTSAKSYCVTVIFDREGRVLKTGKGRGGKAEITPTFKVREEKVTVPAGSAGGNTL